MTRATGGASILRERPQNLVLLTLPDGDTLARKDGRGDLDADAEPGVLPDHLEVQEWLGQGSMGRVCRAWDHRLGRDVAVKLPRVGAPPVSALRLANEAEALRQIDSPFVVRFLDAGSGVVPHGGPWMATELAAGLPLADLLEGGSGLPVMRAVHIAAQVLGALDDVHRAGWLHGDVKPENVLVEWSPVVGDRVTLIDFGVARRLDASSDSDPYTGLAVGSPAYMSPEQAAGGRPDPRSDLYSVGIVLYEMISGARPIDAADARALMKAQIDRPPRPLTLSGHRVRGPLADFVERCLQKDPAQRFPSAAAATLGLARASQARRPLTTLSRPRERQRRWWPWS